MDRGEYSLEELLGEDELLQELRGMHPQLVDFFGKEPAAQRLVVHIILLGEPPPREPLQVQLNDTHMDTGEETQGNAKLSDKKVNADMQTIRYPYMACEVICCEITSIVDALVDGHLADGKSMPIDLNGGEQGHAHLDPRPRPILDLLFSVLYTTPSGQLDDYRAGYLDKVLSVLCRKRPQAMSVYINETSGGLKLLRAMLQHLYSHSILQIVQRLLLPHPESHRPSAEAWEDDDMPENLFRCNWSESPEAIEYLLESLLKKPSSDGDEELRLSEAQNASEVLITVIQNSPLTSTTMITLMSESILERIAIKSSQLEEGEEFLPHDSTLTCAMNVLESLVLQLGGYGSVGTVIEEESEHPTANADSLVKHLPKTLQDLGKLLKHPSTAKWTSPMQFSQDEDQNILGTSRLRIVRLIESLVLLGNPYVDQILCDSKCLETCLDLFWEFEWCSMLHQSVANLLVHIFEGANARAGLQEYFLVKCDLLSRLVESFEDHDVESEGYETMLKRQVRSEMVQKIQKEGAASVDTSPSDDGISVDSDAATPGEQAPEKLPISEEDIDAAMEQQKEAIHPFEIDCLAGEVSPDGGNEIVVAPLNIIPMTGPLNPPIFAPSIMSMSGSVDAPSHIPSLRKGYMGHVIIICQALVHACTTSSDQNRESYDASPSSENMNGVSSTPEMGDGDMSPPNSGTTRIEEDEESYEDSESPPSSPLVIAHLIHNHPLRERWHEFVTTTLAAETAIQSTPLGGFNANAVNVDPLHSHRPGQHGVNDYIDDDDDDDDNHVPGRGLTSGGDVIDMDDNDIEIAASMMEALNMPSRHSAGSDGDDEGAEKPVVKRDFQNANKYMFDDPLGGNQQFGQFDDDEDSSDEEGDRASGLGLRRSSSSGADPPVMDLFAGNFTGENGVFDQPLAGQSGFDFANFDDAFATAVPAPASPFSPVDVFASFPTPEETVTMFSDSAAVGEDIFGSPEQSKVMIDDIFGTAPHSLLLDDPFEGKTKARTQEDCEDPGATQPGLHAISSELSAQEIDSEDVAPLESEDDEPKLPEDDLSSEEEGANVTEARMEDTSIS